MSEEQNGIYSRDQLDCVMFVGIFFLLDTLNVTVILI